MIEYDEIKLRIADNDKKIKDLAAAINYDYLTETADQLNKKSMCDGFWNDIDQSQKVMQQLKNLKDKISAYDRLKTSLEDVRVLVEISEEENDAAMAGEIASSLCEIENLVSKMYLETLLSGEYDKNNAILTLHAGAGGTEAQDWVEMLFRMYTRWGEKHGYKVKTLDYLAGDDAGIKSVSILIEGINAYGYLKSESGVHRLVRISPFDSSGRRHTSFASAEVMPEITDEVQIDISPDDLKIDTYRSGGAGGQHVNKTESAIRITHLPTGIVVACQNERSQHQNKEVAMKMLKSKLVEVKEREHLDKIEDIKGEQLQITWGSQIRSYVFMPYTLAKDHRTNFENGNINAVMDGEIDGFIDAYLKYLANK